MPGQAAGDPSGAAGPDDTGRQRHRACREARGQGELEGEGHRVAQVGEGRRFRGEQRAERALPGRVLLGARGAHRRRTEKKDVEHGGDDVCAVRARLGHVHVTEREVQPRPARHGRRRQPRGTSPSSRDDGVQRGCTRPSHSIARDGVAQGEQQRPARRSARPRRGRHLTASTPVHDHEPHVAAPSRIARPGWIPGASDGNEGHRQFGEPSAPADADQRSTRRRSR